MKYACCVSWRNGSVEFKDVVQVSSRVIIVVHASQWNHCLGYIRFRSSNFNVLVYLNGRITVVKLN